MNSTTTHTLPSQQHYTVHGAGYVHRYCVGGNYAEQIECYVMYAEEQDTSITIVAR